MAGYVELGDVRTWYDEQGEGKPLVLLHPGGADTRAWAPNLDTLAAHFHVFTPERRGHGRTPDVEGPITYELMAADMIAFVEGIVGGPAELVGCSAGASAGYGDKGGKRDDGAQGRNARGMASRPRGAARTGEGADPPRR